MQKYNTLRPLILALLLAIMAVGATAQAAAGDFYQVVNVEADDVLNMRSGSGTGHAVVGTIPSNGRTLVSTGAEQGKWMQMTWGGTTGWVHSKYVSNMEVYPTVQPEPATRPTPVDPRPVANPVSVDSSWRDSYQYQDMPNTVKPKYKPKNKYQYYKQVR